MEQETIEWVRFLLPDHYIVEPTENGIHCYSPIGIDENDSEHWFFIYEAIKQKFGKRLMEIFHQTSYNNKKFTIFLHKDF